MISIPRASVLVFLSPETCWHSNWLYKLRAIECWIRLPASPPFIRLRSFIRLTHHGFLRPLLAALFLVCPMGQVRSGLCANIDQSRRHPGLIVRDLPREIRTSAWKLSSTDIRAAAEWVHARMCAPCRSRGAVRIPYLCKSEPGFLLQVRWFLDGLDMPGV